MALQIAAVAILCLAWVVSRALIQVIDNEWSLAGLALGTIEAGSLISAGVIIGIMIVASCE